MKQVNIAFLFLAAIWLCSSKTITAQTPGVWTGSGTSTITSDAVGIGTSAPAAHLEIEYCDDQQKGFIVTKKDCGYAILAPADIPMTYDGVVQPVFPGEGGGGGPVVFLNPTNFFLTPYLSFMAKPMIWARTENTLLFRPQASGQHTTQFIVTPYGRTGINIENPRATLDVKGLGGRNVPAAIFGRQKPGTVDRTQHIHYVPLLGENGYNQLTQNDDQGIFFTDGMGNDGANFNGAFVIAPWANNADPNVGGLRIDKGGNLEVHGSVKATQLNLAVKWWSDFVFFDNYKLMPLSEVKKFIEENKHLPNIPSEQELCEQGLNVAEMQALHMQKIEELTLYVIEQEKKADELKLRMQEQSKEVESLKAKVKELEVKLDELKDLKKLVAEIITK